LHIASIEAGSLKQGDTVTVKIDRETGKALRETTALPLLIARLKMYSAAM
jgi:alanyl-tRNA synthetase